MEGEPGASGRRGDVGPQVRYDLAINHCVSITCAAHRVQLAPLDTQVLTALRDLLVTKEKQLVCIVSCVC